MDGATEGRASGSDSPQEFGVRTFLFTDIEGSTSRWEKTRVRMGAEVARHDELMRETIAAHGGVVFKTLGDAFCAAFPDPAAAFQAAATAQRSLVREVPHIPVRMAVHTGVAESREGDYFGPALNQVSRLLSAGHGGQILVSQKAADEVSGRLPADTELRFLGRHQLRDLAGRSPIFQLEAPGLTARFPPLHTLDVAFRRGAGRAAAVSGVIVLIVGGLALLANENGRRAESRRRALRHHLYAAQMNLASRACREGRIGAARALLESQRPRAGAASEDDLRDFAWRYLWNSSRGDELAVLSPVGSRVDTVAFSPDGRMVAAGTADGAIRLWETASRRLMEEARAHQGPIGSLAFALEGRLLITLGSEDHSIRVWSVDGKGLSLTQELPGGPGFGLRISVDASGRTLAALAEDGTVHLWALGPGGATIPSGRSLDLRPQGALTLSRDGRWLAAWVGGPPDHAVEVRPLTPRPRSGSKLKVGSSVMLRGHRDIIFGIDSSPTKQFLVTCSADDSVKLWDLATGHARWTATPHSGGATCVAFSSDGRTVASGGGDATIRLIRAGSGDELFVLRGHAGPVSGLAFSSDGRLLASGSWDGSVRLWDVDLARLRQRRRERAPYASIRVSPPGLSTGMVAFSPDGQTLAVGDYQRVTFWEGIAAGKRARKIDPPLRSPSSEEAFNTLAWAPRSEVLATSSFAGRIRLWDTRTRKQLAMFQGSGPITLHLQFGQGYRLVTGSGVGVPMVRVWDVAPRARDGAVSPRLMGEMPGEKGTPLGPAAISPDGRVAATGSPEHRLTLWDLPPTLGPPRDAGSLGAMSGLFSLAFSPDGRLLAAGEGDGSISLWSLVTRRFIRKLAGHAGPAMCMAFCPDGKTLATGGGDHLVRLWRLDTDHEVTVLAGHTRAVYSVAFSPDGNTLASGSTDGTARLWRAAPFAETDRGAGVVASP